MNRQWLLSLFIVVMALLLSLPACTGSGVGEAAPKAFVAVGIEKELRFFLTETIQPPGNSTADPKFKVAQNSAVLDLASRFTQSETGIASELWVLLSDRIRRYPTVGLTETSTALPAPNADLALGSSCEEGSYLRLGPGRALIVCGQKDPSPPKLFSLPLTGSAGLETTIDISSLGTVTARKARYALGRDDGLLILQVRSISPIFTFWPSRTGPTNATSSKEVNPSIFDGQLRDLVYENTGTAPNNRALALVGFGSSTALVGWNLQTDALPERGDKALSFSRLMVDARSSPSRRVLFGNALAQVNSAGVQPINEYTSIGALNLSAGAIGFDGFFYATSNDTSNNYLLTLDLLPTPSSLTSNNFRRVSLDARPSSIAYVQLAVTTP
jgi:hypothetical protein